MQDRPTALELLAAVREFLQQEIAPGLQEHRQRFRTLIAINVLAVVERELAGEEDQLRAEWRRLVALDNTPGQPEPALPETRAALRADIDARKRWLCARIQAGATDDGPWRAAVLNYTRWSVEEKLRIANPRYLARTRG